MKRQDGRENKQESGEKVTDTEKRWGWREERRRSR